MINLKVKVLTILIVITAIIGSSVILATAPKAEVSNNTEKTIPVSVINVIPQNYSPVYQAFGRIESPKQLKLKAQVEGEIGYINSTFVEGGKIEKGEIIYQIDGIEYKNILEQYKNKLAIAQAALQLELGEQKVAEQEFKQIKDNLNKSNLSLQKALMLREPQLATAKANVKIAQSHVKLAAKNLDRCTVTANEDYFILKKNITNDSFVNKGEVVGELIQLSNLRISLAIPSRIARKLSQGQLVTITRENHEKNQAKLAQISPNLHENSQLQQIYLSIENLENTYILGEFVSAELTLPVYKNTLKVPLSVIDNGEVWLIDKENKLFSKKAHTIWQDDEFAIIENNFIEGETIVSSKVSSAHKGITAKIVSGVL